jgi:hypothetical protein
MKRRLKTLLAGGEDYAEAVAWSCKAADPENTRPLAHRTPRFAVSIGGALDAPATAFIYDWNMLPIGQQLWLKWFETLREFPPMQALESYNLSQVMDMIRSGTGHPSD